MVGFKRNLVTITAGAVLTLVGIGATLNLTNYLIAGHIDDGKSCTVVQAQKELSENEGFVGQYLGRFGQIKAHEEYLAENCK